MAMLGHDNDDGIDKEWAFDNKVEVTVLSSERSDKDGDTASILPVVLSEEVTISLAGFCDLSPEDIREEKAIAAMFGTGKGPYESEVCCPLECNRMIPRQCAIDQRRTIQELTKYEQDIILLGQIQILRQRRELAKYFADETDGKKS